MYTSKGFPVKSRLFMIGSTVLFVSLLTGCSSTDTKEDSVSTAQSTSTPSNTNADSQSSANFDPGVIQDLDPQSLETIRNSFNASDREMKTKGGVSFDLVDPNSNITTNFDIGYDGSGYQKTLVGEDGVEEFYWSADTLYTPVAFINEEVKTYVVKVNEDAEWFSEPKSTQFSLITPTRIVESFLAYAKQVSCNNIEDEATTNCTIIATGINYLPGLGGFEPPQDEVRMNITINNSTGLVETIVLFPTQEGLERIINNIVYKNPNIDYPQENNIVTFDQTTEQILIDNPIDDDSPDSPWQKGTDETQPNE
jgi:hypothetical protein